MLQEAIKHLYAVFTRYRPQRPVHGCPCCTSEHEQERLNGTPLRELPPDLLDRYLRKAMTTWGTEENFKYFLPRLLEWFATGPEALDEYFLSVKLVDDAGWADWPDQEREVVLAYFKALWTHLLSTPDGYWQAGQALEVMVALKADLRPFVEQLRQPKACRHLAYLVNRCVWYDRDKGEICMDDRQWPGVAPFLLDTRTLACLEDGYLACAGEDWAPEVADAADHLRAALAHEQS